MNIDFANMDIQTYRNVEYSSLREMGGTHGPEVLFEERVIENPICATRLLLYRPLHSEDRILPVFVNLHGGGFVLGYPEVDDPYCRLIANKAHCLVVSVDYALAPEYQFPKGIENVYGVVKWLHTHADELHIDSGRIAIGGHSAGGNIAAAICLLAKERQEFSLVYQILDYAPLDLATDPGQKGDMTTDEILIGLQNLARKYNAWYLAKKEDAHHPLASPIYAQDVENLPPALVIAAEYDLLCKEDQFYAEKLQQAGNETLFKYYKGCEHGFTHEIHGLVNDEYQRIMAADAWNLICAQLRKAFS
jgi:acetyl esterase